MVIAYLARILLPIVGTELLFVSMLTALPAGCIVSKAAFIGPVTRFAAVLTPIVSFTVVPSGRLVTLWLRRALVSAALWLCRALSAAGGLCSGVLPKLMIEFVIIITDSVFICSRCVFFVSLMLFPFLSGRHICVSGYESQILH